MRHDALQIWNRWFHGAWECNRPGWQTRQGHGRAGSKSQLIVMIIVPIVNRFAK